RVPVVAGVEAKNDNLKAGLGQCIAEMVAARLFNQQRGRELPRVYGVVTTGSLWKLMRLEGGVVSLDLREYPISELGRVVGILVNMVRPENMAVGGGAVVWTLAFTSSHPSPLSAAPHDSTAPTPVLTPSPC